MLLLAEWIQREKQHALDISWLPVAARWGVYVTVCLAIALLGAFDATTFIYFQF